MSERNHPTARPRHRPASRLVTGLVLGAVAVVFVVENTQPVGIRVLVPVVTMPVWAALTAMLVIGVVVGMLAHRRRP